jgi:hypothetical protein
MQGTIKFGKLTTMLEGRESERRGNLLAWRLCGGSIGLSLIKSVFPMTVTMFSQYFFFSSNIASNSAMTSKSFGNRFSFLY